MKLTKGTIMTLSLVGAIAGDQIRLITCRTGCVQLGRACYAAAGFTFGTVPTAAVPPSIVGCNLAFRYCYAGCTLIAAR